MSVRKLSQCKHVFLLISLIGKFGVRDSPKYYIVKKYNDESDQCSSITTIAALFTFDMFPGLYGICMGYGFLGYVSSSFDINPNPNQK